MTDDATAARPNLSRFKLQRPCRHCPFRNDETRIRFASRERAIEIEDQAYRQGFPCHETAEYQDDPEGDRAGFVFGEHSSFCIGYVIMRLKTDGSDGCPWPAIDNDERLLTALSKHLGDWRNAPVFDTEEEFFAANESEKFHRQPPPQHQDDD